MSFANWADVKKGYASLWARAAIRPERLADVRRIAEKILSNRNRYERAAPAVPWWFTGIVHHLESGGNFSTHLHNGDPLTARTVHVPIGRPLGGDPPFDWEESAFDALQMKGLTEELDWSPPKACWNWERFNGFGYTRKGINSPYVWSFTTLYEKGKYVADGVYDANAVSKQVGAATILKCLIEMGEVTAEAIPVAVPAIPVPAPKVEVSAMQDLNDVLKSFSRIAPVIVTAAAGPMAGLAVKALAEAFETEPTAAAVTAKIEAAPLTQSVQAMTKAETTMKALTPPDTPTPSATPVPVDPKMQPGPIDKIVGGSQFTGWKTIIGGALFAAISVLEIMQVAPGILTPDIIESGKWIAGLLAGVGVISKVERWITVFKPQPQTVIISQ